MISGIYKFTNRFNQKVYIGKSNDIKGRYKSYLKPSLRKRCANTLIHRAFNKYGFENFIFEIIHECPESQLEYWEKFFIRYYCSNNPKYGYNMTEGGDGLCGHTPWNKGKTGVYSDDTRKSMGANNIGNQYRKGSSQSEESRELISKHNAKFNKGKHRVYREDGSYYYM